MLLLSEGETAYGKSIDLPVGPDWLAIQYPREISRLRNAYQEGDCGREELALLSAVPELTVL